MRQTTNYDNRCEAFRLSEAKKRQADITPPENKSATIPTGNAYERAYQELFAKLPAWRQKEILDFRETRNFDDRHHADFAKEVAALGDKYHG